MRTGSALILRLKGQLTLQGEPSGSIRARGSCFETHSTALFQASWLSFEAFTSLMRIGFLYYNCLGFDLASDYTDIVLNTVAAVVYNGVASPGHCALVVLKRSVEVHSVVGLVFGTVHTPGHG